MKYQTQSKAQSETAPPMPSKTRQIILIALTLIIMSGFGHIVFLTALANPILAFQNQKKDTKELTKKDWMTILQNSKDNSQRVQAAIELGKEKDSESLQILLDTMDKEAKKNGQLNNDLLLYIVRSLGQIGDKKAFLPLIRLSQKRVSDEVQEEIQHAIDRVQHKP